MARCKCFSSGLLRCILEEGHESFHTNKMGIGWKDNKPFDIRRSVSNFAANPSIRFPNSEAVFKRACPFIKEDLQESVSDGTLADIESSVNEAITLVDNIMSA